MGKTKRKPARGKERQRKALEDEFYRRYANTFGDMGETPMAPETDEFRGMIGDPIQLGNGLGMSRATIAEITEEAQSLVNAKARGSRVPFSVGDPSTDDPRFGSSLIWWTPKELDRFIPLAEHGSIQREYDLRKFVLVCPMILNAMGAFVKKAQSLKWFIESGRNLAAKWQRFFNNVERGQGWDYFVGRVIRAYSESDRGCYMEIVRAAPSWALDENKQLTERGNAAIRRGDDKLWEIVDLRVLDPARCVPTTSAEFPLAFDNPLTGRRHWLRQYNFMHILDMPGVDANQPGMGVCATSRAAWSAKEDQMINRYTMEKISDNPGQGIVAANVPPNLLKTALNKVNAEKQSRGLVYYKGLIFLPLLDPTGRFALELLSFSQLPDNFNRMEEYNIVKEVVAAAFGMDPMELGALPGQQLGSGKQAGVLSEKARGKGMGSFIAAFTRQVRHKLLPAHVSFRFQAQDITEEQGRAEVDNVYFRNVSMMVKAGAWDAELGNKYLALREAIPLTLIESETPNVELSDIETSRAMRYGDIVKIDKDGNVRVLAKCSYNMKAEMVVPVDAGLMLSEIPASASKITESDIDKAHARRYRLSPEIRGLLDATPEE